MEEKLRDHVRMKYRKPFGKISSVIEEAVKELLEKEGQEADERTREDTHAIKLRVSNRYV